jgi:hypothetical protein
LPKGKGAKSVQRKSMNTLSELILPSALVTSSAERNVGPTQAENQGKTEHMEEGVCVWGEGG